MISELVDLRRDCPIEEIVGLEETVQLCLIGRVRDFRLLELGGGLILLGQSVSYHAKQLAQHAVMKATKLPIITNQIEVLSCPFPPE